MAMCSLKLGVYLPDGHIHRFRSKELAHFARLEATEARRTVETGWAWLCFPTKWWVGVLKVTGNLHDRWWQLKYFVEFSSRTLGFHDPIWRAYFSKGLTPSTSPDWKGKPRLGEILLLILFLDLYNPPNTRMPVTRKGWHYRIYMHILYMFRIRNPKLNLCFFWCLLAVGGGSKICFVRITVFIRHGRLWWISPCCSFPMSIQVNLGWC